MLASEGWREAKAVLLGRRDRLRTRLEQADPHDAAAVAGLQGQIKFIRRLVEHPERVFRGDAGEEGEE